MRECNATSAVVTTAVHAALLEPCCHLSATPPADLLCTDIRSCTSFLMMVLCHGQCGINILTEGEGSVAFTQCYVAPGMGVITKEDGSLLAVPCQQGTYGHEDNNFNVRWVEGGGQCLTAAGRGRGCPCRHLTFVPATLASESCGSWLRTAASVSFSPITQLLIDSWAARNF
jgi:hypothetical protein